MNFRQTYAHEGAQEISQPLTAQTQETLHFHLHELFPPGHVLALALQPDTSGLLCLLEDTSTGPRMVTHHSFTAREISLLQPLLAMYPAYGPYEMLLASFYETLTEENVKWYQQARDAQESTSLEEFLKPVRNVLSRTRIKLRVFGIDITGLYETGYVLLPLSGRLRGGKKNKQ